MSVPVSRKLIAHGDELYIVTGNPSDGYYAERIVETELLGRFKRSWQALVACENHAEGDDPREAA